MDILPVSFATTPVTGVQGLGPTNPTDGGFADTLTTQIDNLQGMQAKTDALAAQAATGDLKDAHDYMIASTESALATEMVVAIRNKAVDAFNEIMRMPV